MKPTTRKMVKINIHEEREAIRDYGKDAKRAIAAKDTKAAKVFTHIKNEEKHHLRELKRLK